MKDQLIRLGYLPENVPPNFNSRGIADHFRDTAPAGYIYERKTYRSAPFSASKRGMNRRTFSFVHPVTMHNTAKFVETKWEELSEFMRETQLSFSTPTEDTSEYRALTINSHGELEDARHRRLSRFRFVATTDISRFYHSIYTHSLPWAVHGKAQSKRDRRADSEDTFLNKADRIIQNGQDGQTIGIPVGPDTSRVFAELIGTAIDQSFRRRCNLQTVEIIRHVDDIWIGANSASDAEEALTHYREAIREFELDINESKTRIYDRNFSFTDTWPTRLARSIDTALDQPSGRRRERLRAALEMAYEAATERDDDAILKYVIRYLDNHSDSWSAWETYEPFLKRCAVNYGHTIDYVVQILVWRNRIGQEVDGAEWEIIFRQLLNTHSRLGNDSEVCWIIHACIQLRLEINPTISEQIVRNCGPLAVVAILNCAEADLADVAVFPIALERMELEDATGSFWPVVLEWHTKGWVDQDQITINDDLTSELIGAGCTIFNMAALPSVFEEYEEADFDNIAHALDRRSSSYDDDEDDDSIPHIF